MKNDKVDLMFLYQEALAWGDPMGLVNPEGVIDRRFSEWRKKVLETLKAMPGAKDLVPGFIRTERHYESLLNQWDAKTQYNQSAGKILESIAYVKKLVSA